MLIGVISDIHDNIWALDDVLTKLDSCQVLLCLGDLCAPFTMAAIGEGFEGPVHVVWGNNDGDKLLIAKSASASGNVTLHGNFAELVLSGRSIAMTHYPHLASALAAGGLYDLVCFGHTHEQGTAWEGTTLLLNPGEVMGRFGAHSFATYDTKEGEAQITDLESDNL